MERTRRHLEHFAELAVGESPLYARLAAGAAVDEDILRIAAQAPSDQPAPNLLLGAVHYLLLGGAEHPLVEFFPSVGGSRGDSDAYPAFRDFVLDHREAVGEWVRTRRVQTNEVRRSTVVLPMLTAVAAWAGAPLRLIELGPSAGLNLLFDSYSYDYGPAGSVGAGRPLLRCEVRGAIAPPVPSSFPDVADRFGIDLHPIDVRDDDQVRWLKALVWPDQPERMVRLAEALATARRSPPPVKHGDALKTAPQEATATADGVVPVVMHTFALYQSTPHQRERFSHSLARASRDRPIARIAYEWLRPDRQPAMEITLYVEGKELRIEVGTGHYHGAWIEWRWPGDLR